MTFQLKNMSYLESPRRGSWCEDNQGQASRLANPENPDIIYFHDRSWAHPPCGEPRNYDVRPYPDGGWMTDKCDYCGGPGPAVFFVNWTDPKLPPALTRPLKICLVCVADGRAPKQEQVRK
jgi:hypothetical protein